MSRLISSQKERDFVKSNYDIKRVVSIWICMNMDVNSMNYMHLADEPMVDNYHWKGKRDLINIVMIGLSDELPQHDEKYELYRLLGALLSRKLSVDERLSIIGTEYDIPLEESLRQDMSVMCNLSQGIREDERRDATIEFVTNMYKKGYTLEQIADVMGKNIEEIKAIIEERELALV